MTRSVVSFKQYGGSAPENYQRYFVPTIGLPFATSWLDAAKLRQGERILDIACGTGVVTRLAAEQVGPDGAVSGLDINPGMLAVARSVPSAVPIEWHEASAESLPFADGSFDVALSSLGLQFVPDKSAALREMWRVLVPDGRVAIATVGPISPLFATLEQALTRHVTPEAAAFMKAVFSLYEPRELRRLATDAGFRNVEVQSSPVTLNFPGAAEFLWQYVHSTPLAAAVPHIDDARRAALEDDFVAGSRSFVNDDGTIGDAVSAVVTTGRK